MHRPVEDPDPDEDSTISQALQRLGMDRGHHYDEFAAAGLGRHRRPEGWLAEIGVELGDDPEDEVAEDEDAEDED